MRVATVITWIRAAIIIGSIGLAAVGTMIPAAKPFKPMRIHHPLYPYFHTHILSHRLPTTRIAHSFFSRKIPMPVAYQEDLYRWCQIRHLDYEMTLALIDHESVFSSHYVSSTGDYGYFQINKINFSYFSKKLNTPNEPLNPIVNINWGTYWLSYLYHYWQQKHYDGSQLQNVVLSSYNEGIRGYELNGTESQYVSGVEKSFHLIQDKLKGSLSYEK
jgi:hypothetical protein